ncbi:MAG: alpha/beta hydrolase [Beijerinckiaceae bacterium]
MQPNLQTGRAHFLAVGEKSRAGNKDFARNIALRTTKGAGTPVVWLGGFRSDMMSTKAVAIDEWCKTHGRPMVRMDYTGHGESSGRFEDCTLSTWIEDASAVLTKAVEAPPIIVGSSMGGWIATLIAKRLFEQGKGGKIAGLVLIAPACDFTESLMWAQFPDAIKQEIMEKGVWYRPSEYSPEPNAITRDLIEDGRRNLVFGSSFQVGCPVHILQGMKDPDVPYTHALKLVEHLPLDPVTMTLINDGDHRLSRDQDIARLISAVAGIV